MWDLRGTPAQNDIVRQALAACVFPFERLVPKLQAEKNKSTIPVEWADLSAYGLRLAEAAAAGKHEHIHDGDDVGHAVTDPENRSQVLGLAWYSGKVSLDISLEADPLLAQEVFLAEGAHMVDFFYMTDEHRQYITAALHDFNDDEHGHGWFDVGSYREWVGESFMSVFIRSFAPTIPVTIPFVHMAEGDDARLIRSALLGPGVFATPLGRVFHDSHRLRWPSRWFVSREEALRQGLRACKTCRP